jgi:hypothetical protein
MTESAKTRELWCDLDGTAVVLRSKWHPANWSKWPSPVMSGYLDFLEGVASEGVEIAGIVSRRPDIMVRRWVTWITVHGPNHWLGNYFDMKTNVILAGSSKRKAEFVLRRAQTAKVALIEDKPHKVGMDLVRLMATAEFIGSEVTLGVVNTGDQDTYTSYLIDGVQMIPGTNVFAPVDGSIDIQTGSGSQLHIAMLEPYSFDAGVKFAQAF